MGKNGVQFLDGTKAEQYGAKCDFGNADSIFLAHYGVIPCLHPPMRTPALPSGLPFFRASFLHPSIPSLLSSTVFSDKALTVNIFLGSPYYPHTHKFYTHTHTHTHTSVTTHRTALDNSRWTHVVVRAGHMYWRPCP